MIKLLREYKNHAIYRVHKDLIPYAERLEDVEGTSKNNEIKIKHDSNSLSILEKISDKLKISKLQNIKTRKPAYDNMSQDSQEWKIERTKYVTSTAPRGAKAIDSHALRMAIIEKYGLQEEMYLESEMSSIELMRRGTEFEPLVRDMINNDLKEDFKPIIAKNGLYMSSLDGLNSKRTTILEIKTIKVIDFFKYKTGLESPIDKHREQLVHQQGVTGIKDTILVCYSPILDTYQIWNFRASDSELIELFDTEESLREKKEYYLEELDCE
jgi:hypothetical protein